MSPHRQQALTMLLAVLDAIEGEAVVCVRPRGGQGARVVVCWPERECAAHADLPTVDYPLLPVGQEPHSRYCQRVAADVLAILQGVGQRLTGSQIADALVNAGRRAQRTKLNHTLSEMVKVGLLTNARDHRGSGYLVTEAGTRAFAEEGEQVQEGEPAA